MNTPGWLKMVAPRTRNSMAKRVFPAPALPQMSVGRPEGKPPRVISSKPGMPVRSFCKPLRVLELRRISRDTHVLHADRDFGVLGESVQKGTKGKEFIS